MFQQHLKKQLVNAESDVFNQNQDKEYSYNWMTTETVNRLIKSTQTNVFTVS